MQINDILDNRVEKNLRLVSRISMVVLPDNASFSLEDFVTVQEQHIRNQTDVSDPGSVCRCCVVS